MLEYKKPSYSKAEDIEKITGFAEAPYVAFVVFVVFVIP